VLKKKIILSLFILYIITHVYQKNILNKNFFLYKKKWDSVGISNLYIRKHFIMPHSFIHKKKLNAKSEFSHH